MSKGELFLEWNQFFLDYPDVKSRFSQESNVLLDEVP